MSEVFSGKLWSEKLRNNTSSLTSVLIAMLTKILNADICKKSIKLNHKNTFLVTALLLTMESVLGSLSLKAAAQPPVLSSQAETHALVLSESFEQGSALKSLDASAADLIFNASRLRPEALNLAESVSVPGSNPLAQLPTDPIPETVGQPPSLRTEPASTGELPFQAKKNLLQQSKRYSPSISYLTPSAYGKSLGQFSVGGSFQSKVRFRSESDAFLGGGFGLGDPRKAVGLDVSVGIADVTTFERGTIGFKVHRRLPAQVAIAVGVDNAITWGNVDGEISPYGVVSKAFQLRPDPRSPFSQLYVSAGAGTGRYRSEGDIANRRDSVGVFGSVAVRVIERVNFITEWSGQDLTLGISILPFPKIPLVFTPAVTDVTGTAGDGPRFTFAVGYGFSF